MALNSAQVADGSNRTSNSVGNNWTGNVTEQNVSFDTMCSYLLANK